MKLFIKFMIFSVVVAMAGPFVMKGPNGQPLMDIRDLMPRVSSTSLSGLLPGDADISTATDGATQMLGKQQFYKWKDKNGVWQFSQTPPPPGIENNTVDVYPDANIIQSMPKDKIDSALGRTVTETVNSVTKAPESPLDDLGTGLFPTTVPLDKIPDLINQAKAVQDLMNQRGEQLKNY